MFRCKMRRTSKGFTLIELLVVIAIIAILAAILFPVFARARENARRASCMSNEKQIALGMMMYVQDYDDHFPAHYGYIQSGTVYFWAFVLQPYTKSTQVFFCPSDTLHTTSNVLSSGSLSYGYNFLTLSPNSVNPNGLGISLAAIKYPSATIMTGDTGLNSNSYVITPSSYAASIQPSASHLGGCNFSFVDGHVKWLQTGPVNANYGTANSIWGDQP